MNNNKNNLINYNIKEFLIYIYKYDLNIIIEFC